MPVVPGDNPEETGFTLPFAAPEVLSGTRADQRSDIYSLAATLYAAVAGHPPYPWGADDSLEATLREITSAEPPPMHDWIGPQAFREVVTQGLAASPDERFSTASELGRALLRILASDGDLGSTYLSARDGARRGVRTLVPLRGGFRFVQQPQASEAVVPWLGHDQLVRRLADRFVHADGGAYFVTGFRGVGKSTVVSRALEIARRDDSAARLVSIQLNVARPLASPHLLLVDAIRQIYETFLETDRLSQLGDIARRALEIAYVRTSAVLTERKSGTKDIGGGLGFGKLDLSWRKGSSAEIEHAFTNYSDSDVEHDFLRVTRLLQDESGRRRRRRFGSRRPAERLQVVVVIDELDKLTATSEGVRFLDAILRDLKNVLTAPHVHFVFVAGPDLDDRFGKQGQRGNGLYESIFSLHLYVPVLWHAANQLVPSIVAPAEGDRVPDEFADALRFRSRGITRRLLQQLNDLVEWQDGSPYLRMDERESALFQLHSEVEDAMIVALGKTCDEIPGTLADDRVRLAMYVIVEWILSSAQPQFTVEELRAAMGRPEGEDSTDLTIADEALRLTADHVESLLGQLVDRSIVRRITSSQPGVARTYAIDLVMRRRLIDLELLPRRVIAPSALRQSPVPDDPGPERPGPQEPPLAHGDRTVITSVGEWPPPPGPPGTGAVPPGEPFQPPLAGWSVEPGDAVDPRPPPAPPAASPARPRGTVGDGRYLLVDVAGVADVVTIYDARDQLLDRAVTVRVLDVERVASEPAVRERFLREGRLAMRLRHPNIFEASDVVDDRDGVVAMVSEPVFGQALSDVIRESPLGVAESIAIVLQLLDAVAYLHTEDVHRLDIGPDRIILTPSGIPVISDLGSARLYGHNQTITGQVLVGEIAHLAPELLAGEAPTEASDIYAMGLLLLELVGGALPWVDMALMEVVVAKLNHHRLERPAGIGDELWQVIDRATRFSRDERYPNLGTMADALAALTTPTDDQTGPAGT